MHMLYSVIISKDHKACPLHPSIDSKPPLHVPKSYSAKQSIPVIIISPTAAISAPMYALIPIPPAPPVKAPPDPDLPVTVVVDVFRPVTMPMPIPVPVSLASAAETVLLLGRIGYGGVVAPKGEEEGTGKLGPRPDSG